MTTSIQLDNELELQVAIEFATRAHEGQVRKYTGEPYINHPREVATILWEASQVGPIRVSLIEAMTAALLHDVVEDCGVTFAEIAKQFGDNTAENVYWLSDTISREMGGNRKTRKMLEARKIAGAPLVAKLVKLADFISNTKSIVQHDPDFAVMYLREKEFALKIIEESLNEDEFYLVGVQYLLSNAKKNIAQP